MTDLRTAAQQALEALRHVVRQAQENLVPTIHYGPVHDAMNRLEAALAEYDKDRVKVEEMKANWALQRKLAEETQERDKQQREYEEQRLAALAEPIEPVAWMSKADIKNPSGWRTVFLHTSAMATENSVPLYTAPPQRKPLTEEEIYSLFRTSGSPTAFARAIERAHNITGDNT